MEYQKAKSAFNFHFSRQDNKYRHCPTEVEKLFQLQHIEMKLRTPGKQEYSSH